MGLPTEPVTLTPQQIEALSQQLATMRHDINNHLSLVVAAAELIKSKPQVAERMLTTMSEQPGKITAALKKFTGEFEGAFGIKRP
jgi:hypothetical protein